MIVAKRKPFEEIKESVVGAKRILVLGCGTCVAVCLAGGEKDVAILALQLKMALKLENQDVHIDELTIERQCDREFIEQIGTRVNPDDYDVILSMACGAGVQLLSDVFEHKVVLPALNTTFIGVAEKLGVWSERCSGCGDCILGKTAGLCPIARCAKQLLNGPCGGSVNGKCEISKDVDCVWQLIIDRLTKLDRLEMLEKIFPVKDWSPAGHGGPRKMVREDLKL
ncbi:MAG: hypothetical protein BA865_14180 [Desulfobacterales bacterium S5133MH4]|nr:MAG: hypothetical protein BA865_14180 [Desulfobacterales bacterium S5133MH4]